MALMVVESPTKIKTLGRYVDQDVEFRATFGHLFDLPESDMGLDEDYTPNWTPSNQSAIQDLREEAANHETIYLASDPDREGEAIAWQVREFVLDGQTVHRIRLPSLTEEEINARLADPGSLDRDRVRAQWARRILDRLAGYKVSSFLISAFKGKSLSAGRVQSAVLYEIVRREEAIQSFTPETYYELEIDVLPEDQSPSLTVELVRLGDQDTREEGVLFQDREDLEELSETLETDGLTLVDRDIDRTRTHPANPPDSSTMIGLAASWFGWSSGRTMTLAQQLYEKGLITYHRSDSRRLSREACKKTAAYVSETYGEEYHQWRGGSGGDQDGHEAIRPENPFLTPDDLEYVSEAHEMLYGLLWQQLVQSQMVPAEWERMELEFTDNDRRSELTGSVRRCLEPGMLRCKVGGSDGDTPGLSDRDWEQVKQADQFTVDSLKVEENQTEGPSRYTEGSLIGMMKDEGIGRPSTYSSTIGKLRDRQYIETQEGRIRPTDRGCDVAKFLDRAVPKLTDTGFTEEMESTLDQIAGGEQSWKEFVKQFDDRLEDWLSQADDLEPEGDAEGYKEILDYAECPQCGSDLVEREGQYGKFVHCQDDDCDFSDDPPAKTYRCPRCDRHMVKPGGSQGTVYQCLAHPDCEGKRPVGKPNMTLEEFQQDAPSCPECGGGMEMRKGRWGKFWGCQDYPDCDGTKST